MSKLADIFKAHGCDKAAHGYHAFYETLPPPTRLCEVGVWKGASLRAWREWWPAARVIGLDDFTRGIQPDPNDLNTIQADSRTWKAPAQWAGTFSLLIDDGSHRPRDQAATFRNLWPLLAPNGVYVIEDVLLNEGDPIPPWFARWPRDFTMEAFNELLATIEVEERKGAKSSRHDFRDQSGKPDSVLLVVRKPNVFISIGEPDDELPRPFYTVPFKNHKI
jgi:hypothetical protein